MELPFTDRYEAGRELAGLLDAYTDNPRVVVLGLPRGGLPVAFEVAHALGAPLDVFIVRKLGVPGHEELAFGAIASGGTRVLNNELIDSMGLSRTLIDSVTEREQFELDRREGLYRKGRPRASLQGKVVILIDDGLATGATMSAAVRAIRQHQPERVVVAVPVASNQAVRIIEGEADEVVCGYVPESFYAVGEWYSDFTQTRDDEVQALLDRAAAAQSK